MNYYESSGLVDRIFGEPERVCAFACAGCAHVFIALPSCPTCGRKAGEAMSMRDALRAAFEAGRSAGTREAVSCDVVVNPFGESTGG